MVTPMVTVTRNMGHLLSRSGSSKDTIAPEIPGGLLDGAGFFVSLLVASYGRDLVAELFRSLLTAPQAAWSSCNGTRSYDTVSP